MLTPPGGGPMVFTMSDVTSDPITPQELEARVLHAMGHPLVRLARAFGTPLGEALEALRLAYFRQLKDAGLTLRQIGDLLDISERQAKRLQQQLREQFLDVDEGHTLPTRIEFMLWATPMSRARVRQVLAAQSAAAVDAAIDALIAEGRVSEATGRTPRLSPVRAVNNMVRNTWIARIGGLASLLGNLSDVVYGRFFRSEPRAFARTLSFLVREGDHAELEQLFKDVLVPRIAELDERARAQGDGVPLRLSLIWAPVDLVPEGPPSPAGSPGDTGVSS